MFFLLLIFSQIIFPGEAEAFDNGITVHFTNPQTIEAEPGKIVTAGLILSNASGRDLDLSEEIILPPTWISIASLPHFRLNANEKVVQVITFRIPFNQKPGEYKITYRTNSQATAAEASIKVSIKTALNLMISEASNPESVIAGESYNASIHVINNGNVPESVWLEIKSAPSYSFSVSPAKSVIEPRKSQEFLIHVKTDEKLNNKLNHILKIEAKSDSTGDREIRAVKSINVSVIPKITGNPDLYHRLPVRLSAILVGEKGKSALQSELAGAGNLDESGTRWVDFLFRGPATQNAGLYGQWEQYRFSYGNGLMDLHIGDRNYSLSRLTEQYRYGRGGEAKVHLTRMTTGFYYL
jgi:hypothetical protein